MYIMDSPRFTEKIARRYIEMILQQLDCCESNAPRQIDSNPLYGSTHHRFFYGFLILHVTRL